MSTYVLDQNDKSISAVPANVRRLFPWFFAYPFLPQALEAGIRFEVKEEKDIFASWGGVTIQTIVPSDIEFIRFMVFMAKSFPALHANEPGTVILDIGSHNGFMSMYLASDPNVEKVYSFEPIKEIYERGIRNLSLNPVYSSKVQLQQCAIVDQPVDRASITYYPFFDFLSGTLKTHHEYLDAYQGCGVEIGDAYFRECPAQPFRQVMENVGIRSCCTIHLNTGGNEYDLLQTSFPEVFFFPKIHTILGGCDFSVKEQMHDFFTKKNFSFEYYETCPGQRGVFYSGNMD